MNIVTIPKKLASRGDLVVIPRKEYETLLGWKRIREFTPTASQRRDLKNARRDYKKGRYLSINELKRRLALKG